MKKYNRTGSARAEAITDLANYKKAYKDASKYIGERVVTKTALKNFKKHAEDYAQQQADALSKSRVASAQQQSSDYLANREVLRIRSGERYQ